MLSDQVRRLKPEQLKELEQVMFEAAIAAQVGGNYQEVFRRARIGKIGLLGRIYKALCSATDANLKTMSDMLLEGLV